MSVPDKDAISPVREAIFMKHKLLSKRQRRSFFMSLASVQLLNPEHCRNSPRRSRPRPHCRWRHRPSACGCCVWPRSSGWHSHPYTEPHRSDTALRVGGLMLQTNSPVQHATLDYSNNKDNNRKPFNIHCNPCRVLHSRKPQLLKHYATCWPLQESLADKYSKNKC